MRNSGGCVDGTSTANCHTNPLFWRAFAEFADRELPQNYTKL